MPLLIHSLVIARRSLYVLVLGASAVFACARPRPGEAAASPGPETTSAAWSHVLRVAAEGGPVAKKQLQSVAALRGDEPAALLASRILLLWDDANMSYTAAVPIPLSKECLNEQDRRELPLDTPVGGTVAVRVTVGADGLSTNAEVISGPPNEPLRMLVTRAVRRLRFVPVRQKGKYGPGNVTIVCRQEPLR
jgi:TonB family protein